MQYLQPFDHRLTVLRRAVFEGTNTVACPVLQCVQVKPLAGAQGGPERFRVVFSDISNFVQSMLASRTFVSIQHFEILLIVLRGKSSRS